MLAAPNPDCNYPTEHRYLVVCGFMKRRSKPATKPNTIDDYLAKVSPAKRAALEKLRKDIKAAAPKAEECISYGIPGFRLNGRYLVGLGAAERHCAFYLGSTVQGFGEALALDCCSLWNYSQYII